MDRQVAEAIQGMLAEAGVNVRVEVMEWGAFVDAVWSATAESEVAQARDFAQTAFGNADPGQTFRSTLSPPTGPPPATTRRCSPILRSMPRSRPWNNPWLKKIG